MQKILLVEDETDISEPLQMVLQTEGFAVIIAENLTAAKAKLADCDLVLLDWMLPDGQGIDLLKQMRASSDNRPVIFLTARADLIDKVLGLELGADDYVTKPFEPRELIARIHVRLRGVLPAQRANHRRYFHRGIELDTATRKVTFHSQEIFLAKLEYDLLLLFLQRPGEAISRDEILETVWGFERFPTTRTVDNHVLQLRQKTNPDLIETVRGIGYRMKATES